MNLSEQIKQTVRKIAQQALPWVNTVVILALIVPMILAVQGQRATAQEANRAREVETYDSVIAAVTKYAALDGETGNDASAVREARADFESAYFSALMYASSNSSEERLRVFHALNALLDEVRDEPRVDQERLYTKLLNLVIATCVVHNDERSCTERQLLAVS